MKSYKLKEVIKSIHQGKEIIIDKFSHNLSSEARLEALKQKSIETSSVLNLLKGLVNLNVSKFLICLLFYAMQLTLNIVGPFIINYIISNFLSKVKDVSTIPTMVLLIVCYKAGKSFISIVCDFLYMSLGFQYFAYLYWYILNEYGLNRGNLGKRVNILQYDCNQITNVVYSVLTSLFLFLEIIVLFGLLFAYLIHTSPFEVFAMLVCLYLAAQIMVSIVTFKLNRTYMLKKDTRLSKNISEQNMEDVQREREKELLANKRFLYMKMVSKFVSLVFPMLINVYAFLIANRGTIQEDQYTILIVINMIRNPISELMAAMNINVVIFNSFRRIVQLNEEDSLLQQSQRERPGKMENRERGNVNLKLIWRYFNNTISKRYWFGLCLMFVILTGIRYYGHFVTKSIMAQKCEYYDYIGLCAQIAAPILLYFLLVESIQKVAYSLFPRMKREIDYETLNRISGDIASVDRSLTLTAFDICSSFASILSSYLYSIISLGFWWIQGVLIMFIALCIWGAYALNRFIMHSRREVSRRQLQMKADILKGLLQGSFIDDNSEMKAKWIQIFECKEMGLFIQNYYMGLMNVLMLMLSLIFIILSEWLVEDKLTKSILLMACLNIDNDMLALFLAWVRTELELVSLERVLNALTP